MPSMEGKIAIDYWLLAIGYWLIASDPPVSKGRQRVGSLVSQAVAKSR